MPPLAIRAYSATTALGAGLAAQLEGLRSRRGGLRRNDFDAAAPLDTGIGRVEGLEDAPLPDLAARWRLEQQTAEPVRAILLGHWIEWAERNRDVVPGTWHARVSLLDWGGIPIVAMPGEIFSETGLSVRAACAGRPAFVLAYAEGTPGYIPPRSEFAFGGYEVEEAHRFIGMPGAFSPGSAEALAAAAIELLHERHLTAQPVA